MANAARAEDFFNIFLSSQVVKFHRPIRLDADSLPSQHLTFMNVL
jgi:hypothetical protein